MKRSKMIEIIKEKLLELYMLDFSTQERAEFLLRCIESAGMLPPAEHLDPKKQNGRSLPYYTHEWESENESNY